MTIKNTIYDFADYKDYIRFKVGEKTQRKGLKSALARHLNCQPGFISQVLNGNLHLNLEQATLLNDFFAHTKEESHFLMLLVQRQKAGSKDLEKYFLSQIEEIKNQRLNLTRRLGTSNSLSEVDRTVYYSSWHFAAIHIALTIPELRQPEALATHFRISLSKVHQVLEFLQTTGLVVSGKNGFSSESTLTRIGNDSRSISKHHTNWRLQAIESLDQEDVLDLHYSAVVSLSEKDVRAIKEKILEHIKENVSQIRDSKEEKLYCYTVDFFNLRRK
jgi:uncharacterized protein (TIGR02147 family)